LVDSLRSPANQHGGSMGTNVRSLLVCFVLGTLAAGCQQESPAGVPVKEPAPEREAPSPAPAVVAVCQPGASQACACTNGQSGAQVCKDNGTGWGPCTCTSAPAVSPEPRVVSGPPVQKATLMPSEKSLPAAVENSAEPYILPQMRWTQGGNLHDATIAEWKAATNQNKRATAGAWLSATAWKGYLESPDDFDRLRVKAQMLVNAVDDVVSEIPVESEMAGEKVTAISAGLITMSNDIGP